MTASTYTRAATSAVQGHDWFQERARPTLEQWQPQRLVGIDQLAEDLRAKARVRSHDLPICFLGNAGVGKSTLINALVDPHAFVVPQGGVGPLTAQATVVRFSETPYLHATYHGGQRLNQLIFALDRYRERIVGRPVPAETVELDEETRAEVFVSLPSQESDGDREPATQRIRSYVSQARLLVTSEQFGDESPDELAYLADGLRAALSRPPLGGRSLEQRHEGNIAELRRALSFGDLGRHLDGAINLPDFLQEVKRHASGSIAPLIKSLEVGWPSPLLREGLVLVDLPGVGIANDEYRSVTSEWIRKASAVLLVVERSGVAEASADLLRTTGFLNALLHRDPAVETVSPLLWVVAVRLDDVAKDDRDSHKQQHPGVPLPSWGEFFKQACERAQSLVRRQLEQELDRLSDSAPRETRDDRRAAEQAVLASLRVHAVSAIEYRKLQADDEEERARIKTADESRVPALADDLTGLGRRHIDERSRELQATTAEFLAAIERGLATALDELSTHDREQVRTSALREQFTTFTTPLAIDLARRQGQLRERLRQTIPEAIEKEVARATAAGSHSARDYLATLEKRSWATLRAAVRRGGTYDNRRGLDVPNEIALRFEEPLAVVWNKAVVPRIAQAIEDFSKDVGRVLDKVAAWAMSAPALDARRVERYKLDVVSALRHLASTGETVAEQLRTSAKRELHATIQQTVRLACQRFVEGGHDVGAGVKNRMIGLLQALGKEVSTVASDTATAFLRTTYEGVVKKISDDFQGNADPLTSAQEILLPVRHALAAETLAGRRAEQERVQGLLRELGEMRHGGES